jgi:phage-related tail protein
MPQTRRAKQAGSAALDRARASIEAAETGLKNLQGEVSRDSRDLLKDVGKTLRTARRNLTRGRQQIVRDFEQMQDALVKGKSPRPQKRAPSASRPKRTATARRRKTARSGAASRARGSAPAATKSSR